MVLPRGASRFARDKGSWGGAFQKPSRFQPQSTDLVTERRSVECTGAARTVPAEYRAGLRFRHGCRFEALLASARHGDGESDRVAARRSRFEMTQGTLVLKLVYFRLVAVTPPPDLRSPAAS